jgi:hypothetical protein
MKFMLLLPALPRTGDDAPRVFPADRQVSRSVLRLNWLARRGRELLRRFMPDEHRATDSTSDSGSPPLPSPRVR